MFSKTSIWLDELSDNAFLEALSNTEKRKEQIKNLRLIRRIMLILVIVLMIFLTLLAFMLLFDLLVRGYSTLPVSTFYVFLYVCLLFFTIFHKTDQEIKIFLLKDSMKSQ